MSRDLIVFDPKGIDGFPTSVDEMVDAMDRFVQAAYDAKGSASAPFEDLTPAIQAFIRAWDEKMGEPSLHYPDASGHYCNFNIGTGGDLGWENTLMMFTDLGKKHGLLVIDPQGRQPVMSAPGGGGLLDF